jgi:hypothetical protein
LLLELDAIALVCQSIKDDMKQLANKLARAILQCIVNDLPLHKREFGQAMFAELEQCDGLQALVWASGGIQLWVHARGERIMKNAAFWFGLVAIGILAGGLYVTKGLISSIPVVAIGVIAFSAFRPRDAVPVALLLGLSVPMADLLRVWVTVRTLVSNMDGSSFSGTLRVTTDKILTGSANPIDAYMATDAVLNGSVKLKFLDGEGFKMPDLSSLTTVQANYLPHLTVAILLGAIVIAGIAAFIRSRAV